MLPCEDLITCAPWEDLAGGLGSLAAVPVLGSWMDMEEMLNSI
jgi:hypothetical protein